MKGLSGLANVGHFGTDLAKSIGAELDKQEQEAQVQAFGDELMQREAEHEAEKNKISDEITKNKTKALGTDALTSTTEDAPVKEEVKTETPTATKTETTVVEPKSHEDLMAEITQPSTEQPKTNIKAAAKSAIDKSLPVKAKKEEAKGLILNKVGEAATTPVEKNVDASNKAEEGVQQEKYARDMDKEDYEWKSRQLADLLAKYPKAGDHPLIKHEIQAMKDKYYMAKTGSLEAGTTSKDINNQRAIAQMAYDEPKAKAELGKIISATLLNDANAEKALEYGELLSKKAGSSMFLPMPGKMKDMYAELLVTNRLDPKLFETITKRRGVQQQDIDDIVEKVNMRKPDYNWAQAQAAFSYAKNPATQNTQVMGKTITGTLDLYGDALDALNSGDLVRANKLLQFFGKETSSAPLAVANVIRKSVADEMGRYMKGSQLTDNEIKQWNEIFDLAKGPEAMRAVIEQGKHMVAVRMGATSEMMGGFAPSARPAVGSVKFKVEEVH